MRLSPLLACAALASAADEIDHTQSCVSINGIVKCGEEGGTEWIVQFGSTRNDEVKGLAIDASTERVYVVGHTFGALGGEHRGYGDIWMAGIAHNGQHEWSTQIGTDREDHIAGLAAGDGHVVGGGHTYGHWGEEGSSGQMDGWRGRWDDMGRGQWGLHHDDGGEGVLQAGGEKKDSILGIAGDAWLTKHRHFGMGDAWLGAFRGDDGSHLWTIQVGSEKSDNVTSVAATASGSAVFACGNTYGEVADGSFIGKGDVWVLKADGKTGKIAWTVQIGSDKNDDSMSLVSTPSGDAVYVVGHTFGGYVADGYDHTPQDDGTKPGGRDGFVAKLDGRNGRLMWGRVIGTDRVDFLNDVAVSPDGEARGRKLAIRRETIYVGGQTYGDFDKPIAGKSDAWIAKLDAFDGATAWTAHDSNFGGCSSGLMDAWVARVNPEHAHSFFSELDHEHAAGHACPHKKENGVTKRE
ncbi:hypothetical protein JL721_11727 [Aureococcus anophagefferens]|nr:hypothetical protein JL721_11727 [Aureococcus anophagefferens]